MIRADSGDFVELSRIVVSINFSEMRLTSNFHYQLLRIPLYVHVEISLVEISGHPLQKRRGRKSLLSDLDIILESIFLYGRVFPNSFYKIICFL